MNNCLNCNEILEGNFCKECGQKADTHRLSFHHAVHDVQHNIIHFDKGFLYNLQTIWKPSLIFDYLDGKRVRFFNIFAYLVLSTAIFIYIINLFFGNHGETANATHEINHVDSPLTIGYKIGFAFAFLYKNLKQYLTIIGIIPFTIFSYLFFRNMKLYFWEQFYINQFIFSNLTIISCFVFPIWNQFFPDFNLFYIYVPLVIFMYYQLFKNRNPSSMTILKSILITIFGFAGMLMISYFLGSMILSTK